MSEVPEAGLDPKPEFEPAAACPECGSDVVRPSRSSYPRDKNTNAHGAGAFWRCENCGRRFLGPLVPEKQRRRGHGRSRRPGDPLNRKITFVREAKRVIFPILVILTAILAVVFMLDRRTSQDQQQVILPG